MSIALETMVDPRQLEECAAASVRSGWTDGFAWRWGSADGLLDLAARSGFSSSVLRHLFVRLDGATEPCSLLQFLDENQDSPDVITKLFRAGLRSPLVVPVCAGLSRTIELLDYVLHPSIDPLCYCGNSAKQKGFSRCTKQGYPRADRGTCLYCIGCLRFFDPRDGQVLGSVERCIIGTDGIACRCHRLIRKEPQPWVRDRSVLDCPHCGRQIHLSTGLVVGRKKQSHL